MELDPSEIHSDIVYCRPSNNFISKAGHAGAVGRCQSHNSFAFVCFQ